MEETDGIPEFYAGKNIFITGGFGFLGKVLIEKLLRSCPDIGKLYVIIRPKQGKSVKERLEEINSGLVLKKIKETKPNIVAEKVILLEGDITQKNMGLSQGDYDKLVENVHIVMHLAASIKFDDPLEFAINVNVLGTKRVLELATKIKKIYAFVHVSTAYAHADLLEIKESYYQPKIRWNKMVDIMEKTDKSTFEILSKKIIDTLPNTYVFTKGLAEDLVWEYRNVLPITILRPSIVVSCYQEPVPGWLDNLYGPSGFMLGAAKGVIRVMYSDAHAHAGYIPADTSTRATVSAAWYRHRYGQSDIRDHIYNINHVQSKSSSTILVDCLNYLNEYPLRYPLWRVNVHMTKSYYVFIILFYLTHLVPACILDSLLIIARRKPILFKIQKKYFKAMNLMCIFILREWNFHIDHFKRLDESVPEKDKEDFAPNLEKFDAEEYMRAGFYFGRVHILKDLPGEKYQFWFRNKVLEVLDRIITVGAIAGLGWIVLKIFKIF